MLKYIVCLLFSLLFTGCASLVYDYNSSKNTMIFKTAEKTFYWHKLHNPIYEYTMDRCTTTSYTLKEPRYFIEHITLDSHCNWNGLASGYFELQFKEQLRLKSMGLLQRIEHGNYSFATFIVNERYQLRTITIYSSLSDTFIIDYEGELFKTLYKKLNIKKPYMKSSLPYFKSEYSHSLVRWNLIKNYFGLSFADRSK